MKYLYFSGLLLGAFSASAAIVKEGVFIPSSKPALIKTLQGHPELVIDHMSESGFELYGPSGTKTWLENIGVDYVEVLGNGFGMGTKSRSFADYPSYDQMTESLKALAGKYPKIMKLFSIGQSVKGKELWMVKISDNVEADEVEPEFKYISSMHGNEITGRELTQFWIAEILGSYGKDEKITALVNNTELYIMPSMNPDGSERKARGNAKWVDLNRDFPDWTREEPNMPDGRQPETQAIMDFQAKRQFSLSANYHGGAVVVNYPWDSTYERHPFDALVKGISLEYASLNPEMKNSWEFEDGVTNGADWYKVVGGMQDWSYVWHNDLQVTIEVSETKWPSYSEIPGFYERNRDSMFVFANLIHQGAGFKIKGYEGEGKVKVEKVLYGIMKKDLGTYGFRGGEFYKVLDPGSYVFSVEANGKSYRFEAKVSKEEISKANGNYVYL